MFGLSVRLTGPLAIMPAAVNSGQKLAFIGALAQVGCPDHRIDRFSTASIAVIELYAPQSASRATDQTISLEQGVVFR